MGWGKNLLIAFSIIDVLSNPVAQTVDTVKTIVNDLPQTYVQMQQLPTYKWEDLHKQFKKEQEEKYEDSKATEESIKQEQSPPPDKEAQDGSSSSNNKGEESNKSTIEECNEIKSTEQGVANSVEVDDKGTLAQSTEITNIDNESTTLVEASTTEQAETISQSIDIGMG